MSASDHTTAQRFVTKFGGRWVSGWALADDGPILLTNRATRPLYARWIHHLVWEDVNHHLWEVTPYFNVFNATTIGWRPTWFLVDRQAPPQINADGKCQMLPARYVAVCDDGRCVAECLNRLQHAGPEHQAVWLQWAVRALEQAGFERVQWRVDHTDGRINNAWLFADLRPDDCI